MNNILYTVSNLFCFTLYGEQFLYQLTQAQAGNPALLLDNNWYGNKMKVRVLIDSANNAVSFGSDQAGSQSCLDAESYIIQNQSLFF
jgi:hypothetical protein